MDLKGELKPGAVDLVMSSHTALLGNQLSMFSHISLFSNQPVKTCRGALGQFEQLRGLVNAIQRAIRDTNTSSVQMH